MSKFRLGKPLTKAQLGAWKSLTPIYRGNDLIAFVGMETGWKTPWKLYPIQPAPANRTYDAVDGYWPNPGYHDANAITIHRYGSTKGNGRDTACEHLESVFKFGNAFYRYRDHFLTAEEQEARAIANKADRAEENRRYRQTQITYQNDRQLRLEGLKGIMRKMGNLTSEAEYSALRSTIISLEMEIAEHQRRLDQEQEQEKE